MEGMIRETIEDAGFVVWVYDDYAEIEGRSPEYGIEVTCEIPFDDAGDVDDPEYWASAIDVFRGNWDMEGYADDYLSDGDDRDGIISDLDDLDTLFFELQEEVSML